MSVTKEAILEVLDRWGVLDVREEIADEILNTIPEIDCSNLPEVANYENEIAKRVWEEYWEAEGQHWGNPEIVRDFSDWLDNKEDE